MDPIIQNNLINPYHAITFADYLFKPQTQPIVKEDYVLANAKLIQTLGASVWLTKLIECLTNQIDDKTYAVINPIETISISTRLKGQHKTIVDLKDWLKANTKLIDEIGAEKWLYLLLNILETANNNQA